MILDQLHLKGLGSDLANEASSNEFEEVRLLNLINFIYVLESGLKYIDKMTGLFS